MSQNTLSESAIFRAAAPLAPNERAAYLDRACGENRPLRDEVESLLRAHDPEGSFLKSPAPAPTTDRPISEGPGTIIGPYKLIQLIGEGGMGVVYMAQQMEPVKRLVALKIIKPGMDSRQVIARFEAERQALALMDHPNIAKVLDAGTTDSGRPYFVMELVKGIPITTYCDEKKLTPRERLELFIPVCHAVQHAHQKGIIHRDLKPSNVMIALYDGRPVPKVIDFGVAKAAGGQLTEKTLVTSFGSLVGTLDYMSPEQAELNQLDVDTRSDIYALGVLLYELLTGDTPFDRKRLRSAAFDEMLRIIREEEPPLPSTRLGSSGSLPAVAASRQIDPAKLAGIIRGEIDWIVMKALEKDRSRRYETANGLARDIQRYLADESVDACPPSIGYRMSKISRRYRVPLTIAAGFAALLIFGTAISAWQAMRATTAEQKALKAAAAERGAKDAEAGERLRAVANEKAARDSEQIAKQERDSADREKNNVLAAREELRNTLYTSEMNLIQSAVESGGQCNRVAQLLNQQQPAAGQPDLRGFEWRYWERRLKGRRLRSVEVPQLASLPSFLRLTRSFSREGRRLAAAVGYSPSRPEQPRLLAIFDGVTGELIAPVDPFPDQQEMGNLWRPLLTMSDDGTRVAVAFDNSYGMSVEQFDRVSVRDGGTGSEIRRLEIPGFVSRIALSADGRRIAVQYVGLGQPVASQQAGVNIWDTSTGELVHALPPLPWMSGSRYSRILLSPDGTRLLRNSVSEEIVNNRRGLRQLIQVVNLASGEKLWELPYSSPISLLTPCSWSPDGKLLVVADRVAPTKPTLQLWDSSTGTTLAILDRPGESLLEDATIDFSPDSQRLAVASDTNEIYVWDLTELPLAAGASPLHVAAPNLTLQTSGKEIRGLAFSADGRKLHSVAGTSIVTWDATVREDTGFGPDSMEGPFTAAISADATKVAFSGLIPIGSSGPVARQDAIVWDLAKGREVCRLKTERATSDKLVFSPGGRHVARVQNTNTPQETPQIVIHDAQTGEVLNTLQVDTIPVGQSASSWFPAYYVYPVFRPGGGQMAALIRPSSRAQNPRLRQLMAWDLASGEQLFSVPISVSNTSGRYPGLQYSQGGASLVMVAEDQTEATVVLYDPTTGLPQRSISVPSSSGQDFLYVLHQMFGNFVGSDAFFWDLATGQEWLGLPRSNGSNSYAISPDGSRLVSGKRPLSLYGESEVTLWSLKSGRQLLAFKRQGDVEAISFSPDGNRLIAAFSQFGPSTLKPIQIWDATPLPEEP